MDEIDRYLALHDTRFSSIPEKHRRRAAEIVLMVISSIEGESPTNGMPFSSTDLGRAAHDWRMRRRLKDAGLIEYHDRPYMKPRNLAYVLDRGLLEIPLES